MRFLLNKKQRSLRRELVRCPASPSCRSPWPRVLPSALQVEKEGMKSKLKELERSILRIKESSYLEAQQKR